MSEFLESMYKKTVNMEFAEFPVRWGNSLMETEYTAHEIESKQDRNCDTVLLPHSPAIWNHTTKQIQATPH